MNNIIFQVLPIALLIILYIFIFTRKGEAQRAKVSSRGYDWITFVALIFGSNVLASAMSALGLNLPQPWTMAVLVLFFVFLLIVVLRRARTGKPLVKQMGDERINLIYAKSSRNALFATYLALFVHILITDADALDTMWLVIMLAGGLVVLLASIFFYYYKKS